MDVSVLHVDAGEGRKGVVEDELILGAPEPWPRCPTDPKRHALRPPPPERYGVVLRSPPDDFLLLPDLQIAITDRVRDVFMKHGFAGWQASPVQVRYRGSKALEASEPPQLWRLIVTGWGGVVPEDAGIRKVDGPCPGCGAQRYEGMPVLDGIFDPSRWDGSDFFLIWPIPATTWITWRVAEVIREQGFSGAHVAGREDPYYRGIGVFGIGTRGLSAYMPEARARHLAQIHGLP